VKARYGRLAAIEPRYINHWPKVAKTPRQLREVLASGVRIDQRDLCHLVALRSDIAVKVRVAGAVDDFSTADERVEVWHCTSIRGGGCSSPPFVRETHRPSRPYDRSMSGAPCWDQGYYRLRVRGHLDPSWFERMEVTLEGAPGQTKTTLIAGFVPDQAALHGVLNRIGSLGLTLLSVERVGDAPDC
jgi:hypothetical protein